MSHTNDLFRSPRLPSEPVPESVLADVLAGEPPLPPETTPKAIARVLDATDRQVLYALSRAAIEPEERRGTAPVLDRRHQLDLLDAIAQIGRQPRGDPLLAERAEQLRGSLQAWFAVEAARHSAKVAAQLHAAKLLGLHTLSLQDAVTRELSEYGAILPPSILADVAREVAP